LSLRKKKAREGCNSITQIRPLCCELTRVLESADEGHLDGRYGPGGEVLPVSQGADLEQLLAESQLQYNVAGFRYRGMEEELTQAVPKFDPGLAAQVGRICFMSRPHVCSASHAFLPIAARS
jgi:hypothetical protein